MAMIVTPRLLRRGLEVFAGISVLGFVGLLFYGNNLALFLQAMLSLKWGWALLGVGLASLDWVGGGLRLWIITRHVYPRVTLPGAVVAGGLNTWGGFLTPTQTGGGPLMIYALKRYGVPLPEAMISSLMTFVATVVFFAVAGPVALLLGAGRSLEQHGILGRAFTLYDLFRLSLGGFIAIGLLMIALFVFPEVARRIGQRLVSWLERHGSPRLASRVNELREGVDRSHGCLVAFFRGKGWTALAAAVVLSSLAFGNVTGGSGLAEVLSAAVMSIYVPRVLTPSYILLWRVITCYLTVAFGSFVFWRWLKGAEVRVDGNQLENGHIAPPPRAD
ncbi:MAG: flippase-like domain-containing protein [Gemmatimonadetes bacterium]|nr:flippase-like domain-containing protein [Gemmatimonadota bacterium]